MTINKKIVAQLIVAVFIYAVICTMVNTKIINASEISIIKWFGVKIRSTVDGQWGFTYRWDAITGMWCGLKSSTLSMVRHCLYGLLVIVESVAYSDVIISVIRNGRFPWQKRYTTVTRKKE